MDERPAAVSSTELVEDLFRKEYAHLVSALTRVLGPSSIPLAEDVVHDALVSAMHAWRFGLPQDPKAWIIRAARNRAIDIIRREQRHRSLLPELATTTALTGTIEAALAPAAESASQLAMMFAVCDPGLNRETHVTLILRWLCGLSPKEIGQAFLVDTQTIDRRLHRGRGAAASSWAGCPTWTTCRTSIPGGIRCCDRSICCSTRATTAATRTTRCVRSCARTRCG